MNELKNKTKGGERKVIQPQPEEERKSERKPADALKRLSANVAHASDIKTLQRAIGNRALTNMIQRHSSGTNLNYDFRVRSRDGAKRWLRSTESGPEEV